jgi:hypothetical protein
MINKTDKPLSKVDKRKKKKNQIKKIRLEKGAIGKDSKMVDS